MKVLLSLLLIWHSVSFYSVHKKIQMLEEKSGGRLGISAIDTNNHHVIEYRSAERFPFCSTF